MMIGRCALGCAPLFACLRSFVARSSFCPGHRLGRLGQYRASNVVIASPSPPPSPPTRFARRPVLTSKDRPHCHRNPRLFTESGRELVDHGAGRPSPFFDDRTKAPRSVPRVLTPSERAAL